LVLWSVHWMVLRGIQGAAVLNAVLTAAKVLPLLLFIVLVAIVLAIALIALDPPKVLFGIFCLYGLSGYAVYGWRKFKGKPTSVIAISTDEPDEKGLHP
jgi:amino acid transporter